MLSAICFNLDQSKILSYGNELNMQNSQQHISIALRLGGLTLYYTIPTFNDPEHERGLLKTLWEKEKMLETSVFPFSQNIFYPSQKEFLFWVTFIV